MDSNNPDVSGGFPLAQIFDRSRFPNLDQQSNLPTSSGSYNHYDPAHNFPTQAPNDGYQVAEQPMRPQAAYCQPQGYQVQAPNDGYQVAEQPMRPQAVYCQPPSLQAQAPNDGYQVAEQPMHSQTVYGQSQGFQAPVENRGYQVSARSQLETESSQEVDETCLTLLIKETAKVYKKILNKRNRDFAAQQTASKAQLESKTAEIVRLQNVDRSKTGEIEQLNEKVNELGSGYNRALNENQNLKEKLVEEELAKQHLMETVREQATETQTLKNQLTAKDTEIQASNVQTAVLNSTLAERETEINQLNAKTNSLCGELAAEKEDKQKIANELETLKQKYARAKFELAKKKTVHQSVVMFSSTIIDAAQKTQSNGEHKKSVKRPIPTIDINSGAETLANGGTEQEETHSARKMERESFKRQRKVQMVSSTRRYCDTDESPERKNGPSHQ